MSGYLLTRTLPKGASLSSVGHGSVIDIGCYEVAAALGFGKLSDAAYNLGLAKYCNNKEASIALRQYFKSLVQQTIIREKWQDGEKRAEGLANIMMIEGVYGLQCKKCSGRGGLVLRQGGRRIKKDCEKCQGTGVGVLSQRERGRIANIPSTSWSRNWRPRLDQLMVKVYELENQLVVHMKEQFCRVNE